ncbi:unnamed protein product, partial [Owenia fusiformis]
MYDGRNPNLIVKDGELLKRVLVKDFQYFINRREFNLDIGDVFKKMLLTLKDDEWRHTRSIISPTFSSGKIKQMMEQINICIDGFLMALGEKADANEMFQIKENLAECTMSMIASTAFGIKIDGNSESEKELRNTFLQMANKFINRSLKNRIALIVAFIMPVFNSIINYFGLAKVQKGTVEFYEDIINQALANREGDTSRRIDFLQLMIKAQSDGDDAKKFTKEHILANSLVFFLAGNETVSTSLMWVTYEMSLHQEEQEKVYEEVMEVAGNEDELTYDMLSQMTYLEMFIEESMRIFPAAIRLERAVKEDVTIDGIRFPKGAIVTIPVLGLHHDPEIWPE